MDIKVIEVQSTASLPEHMIGYVCEPSVENAVAQYIERTGVVPEVVYRKVSAGNKTTTLYIPTGGKNAG